MDLLMQIHLYHNQILFFTRKMTQQEMEENFQNAQNGVVVTNRSIVYAFVIIWNELIQWGVGMEEYHVLKCDLIVMSFYVFGCDIVNSGFTKDNKIGFTFKNQNEYENVDYVDFSKGNIAFNNGLNYSPSSSVITSTDSNSCLTCNSICF